MRGTEERVISIKYAAGGGGGTKKRNRQRKNI